MRRRYAKSRRVCKRAKREHRRAARRELSVRLDLGETLRLAQEALHSFAVEMGLVVAALSHQDGPVSLGT